MPYNYGSYQTSPYFSTTGMGMPNNMQSNMQTAVPMQQVQQLLDSGQMTQEQYNQLYNMAMQLKDTFGK